VNPSIVHGHTVKLHHSDLEHRSATYSRCGTERYDLSITFRDCKPGSLVQFIGLNPSTATEEVDDPTVRRCKDFARRWGFSGMVMTNAHALRSTDPQGLYEAKSLFPEWLKNDEYLRYWAFHERVNRVVCCWGNHGAYLDRAKAIVDMLRVFRAPHMRVTLHCFGLTKSKQPKHPLYLSKETKLEEFAT
jgi:hypothetical protein